MASFPDTILRSADPPETEILKRCTESIAVALQRMLVAHNTSAQNNEHRRRPTECLRDRSSMARHKMPSRLTAGSGATERSGTLRLPVPVWTSGFFFVIELRRGKIALSVARALSTGAVPEVWKPRDLRCAERSLSIIIGGWRGTPCPIAEVMAQAKLKRRYARPRASEVGARTGAVRR